ncbi:hypothetical protein FRB96_005421, partial [Tulasnella sp. 330]
MSFGKAMGTSEQFLPPNNQIMYTFPDITLQGPMVNDQTDRTVYFMATASMNAMRVTRANGSSVETIEWMTAFKPKW